MAYLGRRFGLSEVPGNGVFCGKNGVFVAGVPLLEQDREPGNPINGDRARCPISTAISASAMAYRLNSIRRSVLWEQLPGRSGVTT